MVTECEIPPAQFLHEKPSKALKRAGVYAILCDANGRYYVGSSKDMKIRIRGHFNSLLAGNHPNPRMQHSFSKHGSNRFLFIGLEATEKNSQILVDCERKWIRDLDSVKSGFNVMPAANCPLGVVRQNKAPFKAAALARSNDPNSKNNLSYSFVSPEGKSFDGFNVARFCREQGFSKNTGESFRRLLTGRIHSCKGWTSPNAKLSAKRQGSPHAFSLVDPSGKTHTGENLSKFCQSIGVHRSFFSNLIRGLGTRSGWSVTPGFVFERKSRKERILISPNGIVHRFYSIKDFCEKNGLKVHGIKYLFRSDRKGNYGWTKPPCL